MAWVLDAVRIWVLIFGCAAGGWALGFGMGYCRGVRDAVMDDIVTSDHPVSLD
jgi:predicted naringenin-chalcone synthase